MTAPPEPKLLQIGPRPGTPPGAGPSTSSGGEWVPLPDIGPPSSRPVIASAGDIAVLVCSVRGTLYAYRDECASCGSPMGEGTLHREVLTCPCGARYDVCRAGAGLDGLAAHLDPLPLLADSQGVRVAVPAAVPS
jgi:nitrite reductase/ring-hydroxylating ferredoxin subunit